MSCAYKHGYKQIEIDDYTYDVAYNYAKDFRGYYELNIDRIEMHTPWIDDDMIVVLPEVDNDFGARVHEMILQELD